MRQRKLWTSTLAIMITAAALVPTAAMADDNRRDDHGGQKSSRSSDRSSSRQSARSEDRSDRRSSSDNRSYDRSDRRSSSDNRSYDRSDRRSSSDNRSYDRERIDVNVGRRDDSWRRDDRRDDRWHGGYVDRGVDNSWRDLSVLGGVVGIAGLLSGDRDLALLGIGGGLYAEYRYDQDRRSDDRFDRDRYELFSRTSFDYRGDHYVRRERTRDGQRYFYFQRGR